jgi:hypothetical protein
MLRIVHNSNLPASFIADPSPEFKPGQIAELTVVGNQVMATVSTGIAPIGVIDDIRTKSFTNVSWNEVVIVPATGVPGPGGLVTPIDISKELKKSNIMANSFTSTVDVTLNPINGIITFLAGTPLNLDLTGSGHPNAIRTVVSYTYYVPNMPGDDSTMGSGRMTVWYNRMFFQTDVFETNQQYPVRANLYVSENGILTSRKPSSIHPCVALVTAPPSTQSPMLECLWL